jgi:outer membrane protein assembly factor BamB
MRICHCCALVLALTCASRPASAEDWPRFRGPDGAAVSPATGLPLTWSDTENLAWKTALPGPGSSSPVISGDRVYVTCYSGYGVDQFDPGDPEKLVRHVLCLGLADGKVLWNKPVRAAVPEDPYEGSLSQHGFASSTPATDGQRVFVFFGKWGVLAFDRDGNQLWQTSVGTGSAMMGWGSAASPLLYKNLVIVNANPESQSIVALDQKTGREVWKTAAKGYVNSFSTPSLVDVAGGKQELVVFLPDEVWGLDPNKGGLYWYCTGVRGTAIPGLVSAGGVAYVIGGGMGGTGSAAIRAGGSGDVSASRVVWRQSAGSYVPSPVLVDGHLYWVDERGMACCMKADTGKEVYRQRVPEAGNVYASVVAADGKLYAVTRRNGTLVLPAEPTFKVLAHNRLKSDSTDFNASPAVTGGGLLLRSNRAIYCIRAK